MPLVFTDFDTALAEQLDAYRNRITGARVQEGSEIYGRAVLGAAAVAQLSAGLLYVRDQIFPDTADTAHLERHAALLALSRKGPAQAAGSVTLTGTNGTIVASGLVLVASDGVQYTTTSGGTIASGELEVDLEADLGGADGNRSPGDELEVQSPPVGVDITTTVVTLVGGTDAETDAALTLRVLARLRSGDGGGTLADYERWALAVEGTMEVHALRWRRGAGTVTLAVFVDDGLGRRTPAGAGVLTAVETAVELLRPAAAEVDYVAATEVAVNVTAAITEYVDGYDEATVQSAVETAIEDYLYSLRTGETAVRTQLAGAISAVPGVLDFTLTLPAANVEPTLGVSACEILVPGTVTVT